MQMLQVIGRGQKGKEMKKLWKIWGVVLLCLFVSVRVWGDEPGQRPDYYTDYFVIVDSPDGGINIYSEASLDATKLNDELIPNGAVLHIEGEKLAKERVWGLVEYHGMRGYVSFDGCRMTSVEEAIDAEILAGRMEEVDYDVEVASKKGFVSLFRGPGEQFGTQEGVTEIENGKKLHIFKEIESEDKSRWGYTETEEYEGWVKLEDTKKWQDKENVSDMVSMDTEVSEQEVDPTETPRPSQKPQITPTPKITLTPTPTLAQTPTLGPTETPESNLSSADEKENPEGKQVSSEGVTTSSSVAYNPFVWIGVISCMAVIGLLAYHFKKK